MGNLMLNGNSYSGGGSSMHKYTETEQEVGTWVDGGTVYEKTFLLRENNVDQFTTSGSVASGKTYAVGLTGTKFAWIEGYSATRGSSGNTQYTDMGQTENEICVLNHANGDIYLRSKFEPIDIVVTIRYTKASA